MDVSQHRTLSALPKMMKYKVRPGAIDLGKKYEYKIAALLALKVLLKDGDMWMAYNAPDVGAFDDIVLHHAGVTYLLQLKHKESTKNILEQELLAPKGDLALAKYFKDITDLRRAVNSLDGKSEFQKYLGTFHNMNFVIFTNRNVNDLKFLEACGNSLHFLNSRDCGKVHKINVAKLPSPLNTTDSGHYGQLYLLSNQIHVKDVDQQITQEIQDIVEHYGLTQQDAQEIAEQFRNYIMDWAEGNFGIHHHYLLTKTEILQKLSEMLLSKYESNLDVAPLDYNASASSKSIWNRIIEDKTITVINWNVGVPEFVSDYLRDEVKRYFPVEGAFARSTILDLKAKNDFYQKHVHLKVPFLKTVKNKNDVNVLDIYKCLWTTAELPLVLEITKAQQYNDILQIVKLSNYYYKLIILNKCDKQLPICADIKVKSFFTLEDLSEDDRNLILDSSVSLQGRAPTVLRHLIDKSVLEFISCDDIINILTNRFTIGNALPPPVDYFIERRVSKILIKLEVLDEVLDEKFVIEGDCDKYLKVPIMQKKNVYKWENFNWTSAKDRKMINSGAGMLTRKGNSKLSIAHHLIVYDEQYLEWKSSTGPIKNIQPFVVQLDEATDDDILGRLSSKITVISGAPGMGKSMLMNYLAHKIPSSKWVIKIELNAYMDYFQDSTKQTSKHLEYFNESNFYVNNCNKRVANAVFAKLRSSKNITMLLDGFDEVSLLYKEKVTKIAKSFYNQGYNVCLTTRPHMESHLEEELGTLSITLKSFDQDDQKLFLTKYFCSTTNNKDPESLQCIEHFVEELLEATKKNLLDMDAQFTGIPLQSKLIAEVFENDCQKVLENKDPKAFNAKFDLLHLFRNFIDKKINILASKFGSASAKTLLLFKKPQSVLALKLLFPLHADTIEYVEKQPGYRFVSNSKEAELFQEEGIVTVDKDYNYSFTHRTFGEYIAAQWLSEHINSDDIKLRRVARTLINERFNSDYDFLFIMFDRILAEELPSHLDVINGNIDAVMEVINSNTDIFTIIDKCGRTMLHLLSLYSSKYPPLYQGFFQTKDSKAFISSGPPKTDNLLDIINTVSIEKLLLLDSLGYSALDYSLANGSISVAGKICERYSMRNLNVLLENKRYYLGYCVLQGYKSLSNSLFIYFAFKDLILNRVDRECTLKRYCEDMFSQYDLKFNVSDFYDTEIIKQRSVLNLVLTQGPVFIPCLNNWHLDIHMAIIFGSKAQVSQIIRQGGDINEGDRYFCNTALHYAVLHNKKGIINELLLRGADTNKPNVDKNTPLHFLTESSVSKQNSASILKHLKVLSKYLPLRNHEGVPSMLISKGANVNAQNNNGDTPFYVALSNRNENSAKLLLSKDASVNIENKIGENCLHIAAFNGCNDILRNVLLHSVNINSQNIYGNTPLIRAVVGNNLTAVKLLISLSADIHVQNSNGKNCFHQATFYSCHDIMFELLSTDIDVNKRDNNYHTPLMVATANNDLDGVRLLIARGVDVDALDTDNENCLHLAIRYGYKDILHELSWRINNIDQRSSDGSTPLHYAVRYNMLEMVQILLHRGATVEIEDNEGDNALHFAVMYGYNDILSEILSTGVDINKKTKYGNTSLNYAAEGGLLDTTKLLISEGANVNMLNEHGKSCLHIAAAKGYSDTIRVLLSAGAALNMYDNYRNTPLVYAISNNQLQTVKMLLAEGADINSLDKKGQNCLHLAIIYGYTDVVYELLSSKLVNINEICSNGNTPLHVAIRNASMEIAETLIESGADVNVRDKDGDKSLHLAAMHGYTNIIKKILSIGVNVNEQNNAGDTPLLLAVEQNKLDSVKLLISCGANIKVINKDGLYAMSIAVSKGYGDIIFEILSGG